MAHVEFHFDIVCPYAYLGSTQIEAVCARAGATLSWHPFLLGGVFQALDVDPMFTTKLSPAQAAHNRLDALRWAEHLGVEFAWHPMHPVRTVTTMRALLVTGSPRSLIGAFYRAYWVEHRALHRDEVVAEVLDEHGYAGADIVAETKHDHVKTNLRKVSTNAAGVASAPPQCLWRPVVLGARPSTPRRAALATTRLT